MRPEKAIRTQSRLLLEYLLATGLVRDRNRRRTRYKIGDMIVDFGNMGTVNSKLSLVEKFSINADKQMPSF